MIHGLDKRFARLRRLILKRTGLTHDWSDAMFVEIVHKVIKALPHDVDIRKYLSAAQASHLFYIDGVAPPSDVSKATFYQKVKTSTAIIMAVLAIFQDRELVSKLLVLIPAKPKTRGENND